MSADSALRARWCYAAAPRDGTRLFYEDRDPGTVATPVVLCDGIGCDGYVWRHLTPRLRGRRVIHSHYRGHGRSQPPRDRQQIEISDLADDVAAVLDDAEIGAAVWIGHSMGVQVALEAWRHHRDRVAGLILVCGAPGHPLRTFRGADTLERALPAVQRWIARVPRFLNGVTRSVLPTRLALEVAGRLEINRALVDPADFMPYLEGMARMDVQTFAAILGAAGRHSAEAWLAEIDVPTLVIAGDRDGFTPPQRSRDMIAQIPGCEGCFIAEGSHTAPIERPEVVGDRVEAFLSSHSL